MPSRAQGKGGAMLARVMPKAELHCHIEGAARPELVLEQARRKGVDASRFVDGARGYIWQDFTSFLAAYDFAASLFDTPEDYVRLTEDHYLNLSAQNCIYGEVFASSDHAEHNGFSYGELIAAMAEGMERARLATGIEGRIIPVGIRHKGPEAVMRAAQLAVAHPHPLVTGFGMAGDERFGEPADFAAAFAMAGEAGLGLTVHAGELCGPRSVREAIDHLGVRRIGHGVRAIEDAALVERLAAERIVLEVCPASNIALGVYGSYGAHPLAKLREAGCIVTLNSDDPPHFSSSIEREYEIAAEEFGFDGDALAEMTANALEAAFVDGDTRQRLLEKCGALRLT